MAKATSGRRPPETGRPGPLPGTLHRRPARLLAAALLAVALLVSAPGPAPAAVPQDLIYPEAPRKPVDSVLKVAVGDPAPDFALPALPGPYTPKDGPGAGLVRLSDFRGRYAVVISFVPAAFSPVCSGQWPGYNIARDEFERRGAVLLGITTDNLPSLYAWTREMGERAPGPGSGEGGRHGGEDDASGGTGVWFPVLSDFWPHGAAAAAYGVLRGDGRTERALFVIDRQGVIRHIHVADINKRPPLDIILRALDALPAP
ncbi:redoxin domain-containing protein [Nitratidesulfovibrio sp. 1201_IL3209]|uniref:redoxin domain-containing protein n=1 Tax=Nitratidesulfovibrio sp. 1201_IL3209 TaxID=3084053 RepID=UPI002FD98A1B